MDTSITTDLGKLTISEEDVKKFEQEQKEFQETEHNKVKETVIQSLESIVIPEPPSLEEVKTIDVGGYRYVAIEDYELAVNMLSSEAPNAHAVLNVEFTKVVDLLRHAVGCLHAISVTHVEGTVSERLAKVRQIAGDTGKDICKSLGV